MVMSEAGVCVETTRWPPNRTLFLMVRLGSTLRIGVDTMIPTGPFDETRLLFSSGMEGGDEHGYDGSSPSQEERESSSVTFVLAESEKLVTSSLHCFHGFWVIGEENSATSDGLITWSGEDVQAMRMIACGRI